MKKIYFCLIALATLSACQNPAPPGMKTGKAYMVNGLPYFPSYDPDYDETGVASWYGPGFNGKPTATGEIYNQNDFTAAHPTLPMPSIVRVTNLTSGKSLILRINDRGPFKSSRIIDLSKASAEALGIKSTARVRVQFLKKETEDYVAALKHGQTIDIASYNNASHSAPIIEEAIAAPVVEEEPQAEAAPEEDVTSNDLTESDLAPPPGALPANVPFKKAVPPTAAEETVEEEPESITPSPPPAEEASHTSGWFITAGSFASQENANRRSQALAEFGQVIVKQATINDKQWWVVRVGPFDNKQSAQPVLEKVRSQGIADAHLIHQGE